MSLKVTGEIHNPAIQNNRNAHSSWSDEPLGCVQETCTIAFVQWRHDKCPQFWCVVSNNPPMGADSRNKKRKGQILRTILAPGLCAGVEYPCLNLVGQIQYMHWTHSTSCPFNSSWDMLEICIPQCVSDSWELGCVSEGTYPRMRALSEVVPSQCYGGWGSLLSDKGPNHTKRGLRKSELRQDNYQAVCNGNQKTPEATWSIKFISGWWRKCKREKYAPHGCPSNLTAL